MMIADNTIVVCAIPAPYGAKLSNGGGFYGGFKVVAIALEPQTFS